MGAAKTCETFNKAVSLFRALQYANDMGTHGGHFEELEEHFIAKQGLMDYCKNGFTVAQASDKVNGSKGTRVLTYEESMER